MRINGAVTTSRLKQAVIEAVSTLTSSTGRPNSWPPVTPLADRAGGQINDRA
jgi:hypothetical protein